jgi:crotonobetainyl-CoA:carnitine CoA-transferase CaiB-like acyl-CoA transferase
MLANMGAEVVKIERPGHGDDLRRTVPYKGREGHEDYFR